MKKVIPFSGPFPLSKAIIYDHKYTMEISGQIGVNPDTNELEEGITKQTHRIMELLKEILEEVGWGFENIIKTRIFLSDMKHYDEMNKVYASYFSKDYPTRFALAVKGLPRGALVEIDCSAAGDSIKQNI